MFWIKLSFMSLFAFFIIRAGVGPSQPLCLENSADYLDQPGIRLPRGMKRDPQPVYFDPMVLMKVFEAHPLVSLEYLENLPNMLEQAQNEIATLQVSNAKNPPKKARSQTVFRQPFHLPLPRFPVFHKKDGEKKQSYQPFSPHPPSHLFLRRFLVKNCPASIMLGIVRDPFPLHSRKTCIFDLDTKEPYFEGVLDLYQFLKTRVESGGASESCPDTDSLKSDASEADASEENPSEPDDDLLVPVLPLHELPASRIDPTVILETAEFWIDYLEVFKKKLEKAVKRHIAIQNQKFSSKKRAPLANT